MWWIRRRGAAHGVSGREGRGGLLADQRWALLWTRTEQSGRLRMQQHVWIESVVAYYPDSADIALGEDWFQTLVKGVPYSELSVVRIR